jgi:hypothetical protein
MAARVVAIAVVVTYFGAHTRAGTVIDAFSRREYATVKDCYPPVVGTNLIGEAIATRVHVSALFGRDAASSLATRTLINSRQFPRWASGREHLALSIPMAARDIERTAAKSTGSRFYAKHVATRHSTRDIGIAPRNGASGFGLRYAITAIAVQDAFIVVKTFVLARSRITAIGAARQSAIYMTSAS